MMSAWRLRVLVVVFACCGCVVAQSDPSPGVWQDFERLMDQGVYHMRRGELSAAHASFSVAHDLVPAASALDGLGCVAFLTGNLDSAERLFLGALTADPGYYEAIGHLALLAEHRGRRDEALALYRRAVDMDPKNVSARNNYAAFLVGMGEGAPLSAAEEQLRAGYALARHPIVERNIYKLGLEPNS